MGKGIVTRAKLLNEIVSYQTALGMNNRPWCYAPNNRQLIYAGMQISL